MDKTDGQRPEKRRRACSEGNDVVVSLHKQFQVARQENVPDQLNDRGEDNQNVSAGPQNREEDDNTERPVSGEYDTDWEFLYGKPSDQPSASAQSAVGGDARPIVPAHTNIVEDLRFDVSFPKNTNRCSYNDLTYDSQRLVDVNPDQLFVSYPTVGITRRIDVYARRELVYGPLNCNTNSCREAQEFDFRWLNAPFNQCATSIEEDGLIYVAPLHFLPPRCVLERGLRGHSTDEQLKDLEDKLQWHDRHIGFKPVPYCRSGYVYVVRSEVGLVRAAILGMGHTSTFFRYICLDINRVADIEKDKILHLPPEFCTTAFPSNLILAKLNTVKWVPHTLNITLGMICTQYTPNFVAGYLYRTEKENLPQLDWIHNRSEWSSTSLSRYREEGILFEKEKYCRVSPMDLEEFKNLFVGGQYRRCETLGSKGKTKKSAAQQDDVIQKMTSVFELVSSALPEASDADARRHLKSAAVTFASALSAALPRSSSTEANVEKILKDIEELAQ